jgi:hypothetical protein
MFEILFSIFSSTQVVSYVLRLKILYSFLLSSIIKFYKPFSFTDTLKSHCIRELLNKIKDWLLIQFINLVFSLRNTVDRLCFDRCGEKYSKLQLTCLLLCISKLVWITLEALFVIKAKAVPLHATKELGERGDIAPTHSRPQYWMGWVVSVTFQPHFSLWEKTPGTHCTGGWVGPRSGLYTEVRGEILSPLPGIEPRSPGRPARSQTLYWLS